MTIDTTNFVIQSSVQALRSFNNSLLALEAVQMGLSLSPCGHHLPSRCCVLDHHKDYRTSKSPLVLTVSPQSIRPFIIQGLTAIAMSCMSIVLPASPQLAKPSE